MEEQEIYRRGKVAVTSAKFTVANKSYTIKNIASVSVETIPANKVPLIIVLVAGAFIMLVKGMILVGAAIVAVGLVFYILMKDEYAVRISAATGESADSFISKDRAYAEEVAGALNEAVRRAADSNHINETKYISVRPDFLASFKI